MAIGRVLVVEDDDAIRRGVCDALELSGYDTADAPDGERGAEMALAGGFDLVLLALMMPKKDGLQVLKEIRSAHPGMPVIVITAKGESEDRVRGLRLGADDYVVKPFGVDELIARVEAVLRRSAERPRGVKNIDVAGRRVDFQRRELTFNGRTVTLPQLEADLLAYLAQHPGRAVARDELLQRVWGVDPRGMQTRTVDMAVARLREQLEDDANDPEVIKTVRGKGYVLAAEPTDVDATSAGANPSDAAPEDSA